MTNGILCGWRVRSTLPLPELAPWSGDDRPPDIVIRVGAVPEHLDDSVKAGAIVRIDSHGRCLLRIENVAAFLVTGPEEVVVAPHPGAAETDIRVFLLGSVLGFLCHLRGLYPLHASCVAISGKAIAFCGPTGAGKSTTAANLAKRGHPLVADDITVIDTQAPAGPQVLPAFPRLKLSQEALSSLPGARVALERDGLRLRKFHYISDKLFSATPVRLGGIFLLRQAAPDEPEGCAPLSRPVPKMAALRKEIFRPQAAAVLRTPQSLLAAQAAIAASTPIWRITRRFDLTAMNSWLSQIEALVSETNSPSP